MPGRSAGTNFSVFSTYVEVFPAIPDNFGRVSGLLHVRGGVSYAQRFSLGDFTVFSTYVEVFPAAAFRSKRFLRSSPRTWRCFLFAAARRQNAEVFSTYVEVFLQSALKSPPPSGLLHVRGGVSQPFNRPPRVHWSSPRTWRCF